MSTDVAQTNLSPSTKRSPEVEQHAENTGESSLLDLAVVLAEQKTTIFSVTAIFAVLSVALALLLPKQYTASVTLLPPKESPSLSSALSSQLGSLGGMAALAGGSLGLKSSNDTIVGILKSRSVEMAVVQRFNLVQEYHAEFPEDARAAFERNAEVSGDGKDGFIHIAVRNRDPRRAAELANGYVDQFRKVSEHLAVTEAAQRRLFFERQLEEAKNNLANAEEEMKKTEQRTGVIQLDSQARALIESAASLRAEIVAKEVQIESLRTFATDQNEQLVQAQRELDSLRAQLAKLGGSADGEETGIIEPRGKVSEAGLEYVRRIRDVKYYETIFEILARQFEAAKLDEAKQGGLIQVLDPAVPPDRKSAPKRLLIIIGFTGFGFFLSSLFVIIRAMYRRALADSQTAGNLHRLRAALFRRG